MMTVNRKIRPELSELSLPSLLPHTCTKLSNGIGLIVLSDPSQEVFKMDVIFEAGPYYQPSPLIASTALHMLNEGTRHHTSAAIAETFDYYGAYIDFNNGMHKAELNLLSLNKYANETIDMLAEMVRESIFPEHELEIYLRNKKQAFLTEKEKTSWLARKEFFRVLFGKNHPYANVTHERDYESVKRQSLVDFYRERINAAHCSIVLSGNVTGPIQNQVADLFGTLGHPAVSPSIPRYEFQPSAPGSYNVPKTNAVQSSIRIGKSGVSLVQKDYAAFQLLNMVLGGYFGSRLMSNIREEKGYTYGIYSFNVTLPKASYWCVTADVNSQFTEAAIEETLKEIRKIQTELIPEEELALVKNYYHGELLREIDGVFSQADSLKNKLTYGMDNSIYRNIIEQIKTCTPEYLLDLANRYLKTEELYIVTSGPGKI